jgi:hypothetical protein
MKDKDSEAANQKHLGGNPEFWKDEVVRNYDYQQSIVLHAENGSGLFCLHDHDYGDIG